MNNKMNTKVRLVRCPRCRQVLPELPEVPVYQCGGCGAVLQAKKPKNGTVGATFGKPEEGSSCDWKTEQASGVKEGGSGLNQQSAVDTIEPDRNRDHNEPRSSTELSSHEDPESSPEAMARNQIDQVQDRVLEHDRDQERNKDRDHEHNQDRDRDRNEIRSSMELSSHEDPESSPEATHDQMDRDQEHDRNHNQDQENDHNQDHEEDVFMANGILENRKNGGEFGESSSELTASPEKCSSSEADKPSRKAVAKEEIVKGSDGGSKSSFKTLIAEKLLDTRQRKVLNLEDDDALLEDETADLRHRRRFERISSVEASENSRFGNTSYYYDGSVSSFDGNDDRAAGKSGVGWRHERRGKDPVKRLEKDEHRSMGVRSFYGNVSPSRLHFDKFHEHSRNRSPVIPEDPKREKLELLKMVRELQDQLERTKVQKYYNQVPNQRFGRRIAFSGEAAAVHSGAPCYHCCPPDHRHFSAQLPRQCVCCNGPHYRPNTYLSPHYSGQSSPQHHSGSEFSVLSQPDLWHRNDTPKKRHLRPIAGGAALVACYRCSQLLQLPQSFLVFKKRYHSLRCGSCLKVLNFTLSSGTHVTRYCPEETIAAPPCSEVDDYADSPASRVGPVSCSDRSFQKSYSTETDKRGSSELIERKMDKWMVLKDPTDSSVGNSSGWKKTTEIEEIEAASSGSPLHRLMGYASPSKVLRG